MNAIWRPRSPRELPLWFLLGGAFAEVAYVATGELIPLGRPWYYVGVFLAVFIAMFLPWAVGVVIPAATGVGAYCFFDSLLSIEKVSNVIRCYVRLPLTSEEGQISRILFAAVVGTLTHAIGRWIRTQRYASRGRIGEWFLRLLCGLVSTGVLPVASGYILYRLSFNCIDWSIFIDHLVGVGTWLVVLTRNLKATVEFLGHRSSGFPVDGSGAFAFVFRSLVRSVLVCLFPLAAGGIYVLFYLPHHGVLHSETLTLHGSVEKSSVRFAGMVGEPVGGKGVLVGGLALFVLVGVLGGRRSANSLLPIPVFKRGQILKNRYDVMPLADVLLAPEEHGLFFGGIMIPEACLTRHLSITGVTGSGKTLTLRLLMQSALTRRRAAKDRRAIVFDPKRDMVSVLHSINKRVRIVILNPFDTRSAGWEVSKDIRDPASAEEFARILVPEKDEGANQFFVDAVRELLKGLVVSFILRCPDSWTLRDVVLAMRSESSLRQVLSATPHTRHLLTYFNEKRTAQNILSSVLTKIAPYEILAAAWDRSKEQVSLCDWLKSDWILVLGSDESVRSSMDSVNRLLLKRMVELVLSEPDSCDRETWVFLDEVREAGKLEGLRQLLTQGRSKGARVVLGFQDIDGMRAVYGKEVADELVGQCGNGVILRLESPATEEWASKTVGDAEWYEYKRTLSISEGTGGTHSVTDGLSVDVVKREAMLPSEFNNLPPASHGGGVTGIFRTAELGVFRSHIPGSALAQLLVPGRADVPNFIPRQKEDLYLRPWEERDLNRLGLSEALREPRRQEKKSGLKFINQDFESEGFGDEIDSKREDESEGKDGLGPEHRI
jgi:hypothetical protein